MGNCHAAATAIAEIQYPEGKIERIYGSVSASHVMATNPGHYVAVVLTSPHATKFESNNVINNKAEKYLKLLSPEDTLLLGNVYRLVTFEEVLRVFRSKRSVKLSCLLVKHEKPCNTPCSTEMDGVRVFKETKSETGELISKTEEGMDEDGFRKVEMCRTQWKPALQCIKEETGFDKKHQSYTE
ncbi:D-ribose-binding periplasmic protein [Rhynchospora pubera]|uniref:D-ribose-binding periplasmic protein n=1 Tax=Rhynchospora pubera TaxID=906938 RepID=A0AAV8HKL4_9POAL|nr:D-ribose-binding periplasmic protein [Rhynchospora pubera]